LVRLQFFDPLSVRYPDQRRELQLQNDAPPRAGIDRAEERGLVHRRGVGGESDPPRLSRLPDGRRLFPEDPGHLDPGITRGNRKDVAGAGGAVSRNEATSGSAKSSPPASQSVVASLFAPAAEGSARLSAGCRRAAQLLLRQRPIVTLGAGPGLVEA